MGFEDALNLYAFVRNNPLRYQDLDGQFAIVIPILSFALGEAVAISAPTLGAIGGAITGCALAWTVHNIDHQYDQRYLNEKKDEKDKDENEDWAPPYDGSKLGDDPSKCPGDGFEWKGRGTPSEGKGSW